MSYAKTLKIALTCIAVSFVSITLSIMLSEYNLPRMYTYAFIGISVLPLMHLIHVGMNTEYLNSMLLALMWAIYMTLLTFPCYLLVNKYILMSMYLPLLLIFAQKPHHKANSIFLFLETWLWDRPLYVWAHIVNMIGSRGFAPFISHIRSEEEANQGAGFITLGSWPLESDVARYFVGESSDHRDNVLDGSKSIDEKYNVGCVVNLCREYPGPIQEYIKYNILQFHCPLPDMKEPTWSSVLEAVSFLAIFRSNEKNKGKRAFIHCKGGRARSGTVVICYLLTTMNGKKRYTLSEAFSLMKSCRHIVDQRLPTYKIVQRFDKELQENNGNFDRLLMRYMIDTKKQSLRSVKEYD